MAIEETASDAGWLGDMTIAAGGVTVCTVVTKGTFQRRVIFRRTSSIQDSPVTLQCGMQAVLEDSIQVRVTFETNSGFGLTGASDHVLVGGIFIKRLHTFMTISACNVTMYRLKKAFRFD